MIQDTGGTCPKTWSARPLVQKLDSRSLGRCPWQVCFIRWRLPDWSCYSNTNSLAQTEIKRAAHRRLLDWSWSQQNREKPKGQLGGDCLSGLGPNRNRENQKAAQRRLLDQVQRGNRRLLDWSWSQQGKPKGSSPETARPVLVTQPKAAHRRLLDWSWSQQKQGQLTGDCSTGLGPNRNGENQQQLTGDCSTSFGHSTQREDNQPLTQRGRGARRA